MAGISLEVAQTMLTGWLSAETSLASSQSYEITVEGNTRKLTRADLAAVAERIKYWQSVVAQLSGNARRLSRTRYVRN
jgi:hypothetical protein